MKRVLDIFFFCIFVLELAAGISTVFYIVMLMLAVYSDFVSIEGVPTYWIRAVVCALATWVLNTTRFLFR